MVMPANPSFVWSPLPGSQRIALDSRCDHTLYEGARGPGKSTIQLMRFFRHVGKGYGAFWKGIIFDLEFDNLGGLVTESKKWFGKFGDGAKFYESTAAYKWVWPTGEELLFRHVKKLQDYDGFHGWEVPFLGWNELTKYRDLELYDKFMSINRSSFDPLIHTPINPITGRYDTPNGKPLPPLPIQVFSTTNPNGPGHNAVKRRFISCAPRGVVVKREVEIFNPKKQENDIFIKSQIAIFGSYRENVYLPPSYIAELETISDPNLRRAWLYGDWDVTAGGAIDDLWATDIHVVKPFKIPLSWRVDRSFDWGSSKPFSVGWWAEANGEEVEIDGKRIAFPRGSLFRIYEWYGCDKDKSNVGLKMSATDVALGIKAKEKQLVESKLIASHPYAGPADNAIANVLEAESESIKSKMAVQGIYWNDSDKRAGSRKNGLQLFRDMLEASVKFAKTGDPETGPGIYFFSNCEAAISILPTLPRDPDDMDDVDSDAEDHIYDEVRYRVLALNFKSYEFSSGGTF